MASLKPEIAFYHLKRFSIPFWVAIVLIELLFGENNIAKLFRWPYICLYHNNSRSRISLRVERCWVSSDEFDSMPLKEECELNWLWLVVDDHERGVRAANDYLFIKIYMFILLTFTRVQYAFIQI